MQPTALKSEGQFSQGPWVKCGRLATPLTPTPSMLPRNPGDRKLGFYCVALSPLTLQMIWSLTEDIGSAPLPGLAPYAAKQPSWSLETKQSRL